MYIIAMTRQSKIKHKIKHKQYQLLKHSCFYFKIIWTKLPVKFEITSNKTILEIYLGCLG